MKQHQPCEGIMKRTSLIQTAAVVAMLAALSACKKPDEPVGPAQKAGAAIDSVGEKAAAQLHEGIDKVHKATEDMNERARHAGDEVQEAAKDAADDANKGISKATEVVGKKVEKAGEKIQDAARKN
jgi:methyl-accepting chemotaxis protein